MLVLALDTTMAACSAAVFDSGNGKVLASDHVAMEKGHAEALAAMVQKVLGDATVAPLQLGRIAVTTGPGTFTGLRIGLSLALGMAVALDCPVVGLDTLTATAAPLLNTQEPLCIIHQAGATGKFYVARFALGEMAGGIGFCSLEDCLAQAASVVGPMRLLGTGAERLAAAAPQLFIRGEHPDLPSAARFVAYAAALPEPAGDPQPHYLREPDAKPSAISPPVAIRLATGADLVRMSQLHGMCFAEGWSEESLRSSLALAGAGALVAEINGTVRAFVLWQAAAGEAEILTLCSEPRWRRRALAEQLLSHLLDLLRIQMIKRLHLEVASDNVAAVALYHKLGFAVTGRRRGYYGRKDAEAADAIVMTFVP